MPTIGRARDVWHAAYEAGQGREDLAPILRYIAEMNGTAVRNNRSLTTQRGHRSGAREILGENTNMTDDLQRLIDKDQIRDVLLRYARGVDRREWELVRATFFEDGYDDHADFSGSRDNFIAFVREKHDASSFAKSTHLLGNCLIELASDRVAAVETYFVANLQMGPDAGSQRAMLDAQHADSRENMRVEVVGRYVDRFEKRDGEWRVVRRRTVFDTIRTELGGSLDGGLNPAWVLGRRDRQDPVFAVRAEAGLE
ncbi:conserved hypothetical protein [Burkholderia sp. 8Y]|nr:conserved hypothetical protein [Burkholderia sp. 8Y]